MYLEEFIAEIETDLSAYAESGDIDRISIKRWVINELKRFGTDILEKGEKVLQIKNSQAELPKTFRSLILALKVEPHGYHYDGDERDLEDSYIIRQRIENPAFYQEVRGEYETNCDSKIITEIITINNKSLKMYYEHPKFLSLTKGIKRDNIAADCLNLNPLIRQKAKHEINISQNQLNTNFSKGTVYIQYNMLPTDENGEVYIPETSTGFLEKYLEYYVKGRIVENLIANNRNPQAIAQLLQMYKQEAQNHLGLAIREAKFKGLGNHWVKNLKAVNHRSMSVFKLPTLTRFPDPRFY